MYLMLGQYKRLSEIQLSELREARSIDSRHSVRHSIGLNFIGQLSLAGYPSCNNNLITLAVIKYLIKED